MMERSREPSESGNVQQARDDVSVGGATSMVYVSKTAQKIKMDGDDLKVEFEFGAGSEVSG